MFAVSAPDAVTLNKAMKGGHLLLEEGKKFKNVGNWYLVMFLS